MKILHWLVAVTLALASMAVLGASTVLGTMQLPAGSYASVGVDPVLHRFYAVNSTTGTLIAVDADTLQTVGTAAVDANASRLRVDAAHHRLYLVHNGSPGQMTVFDSQSLAVVAKSALTDKPLDLAVDFRRGEIYIIHDETGNHFTVFSTKTNTVVASLALGSYMYGITVDRNNGKVYVPQYGAKTVAVISQASHTVVKKIPVNMNPVGAIADEKSGSVFISGFADLTATKVDQVAVVGSDSDTVRTTLGGMVLSMANVGRFDPVVSPVYGRAYFSNPEQGRVYATDAAMGSAGKSIAVAANPSVAAVNSADGEIYVVDRGGSQVVTVLDARLERVAGTLNVGLVTPSVAGLVGNRLLLFGRDTAGNANLVAATPYGIQPETIIVADFHHAGFDHYFHSASSEETRVLQDGIFGTDWLPTQQFWRVWKTPGPGRVPVCRFFSSGFGTKSSHFYTPYATECADLKNGSTRTYEETSYYVALPDDSGACSPAFEELYRLYNNGMGGAPNHAYTNDRAKRDELQAKGWTPEGSGPQSVFACTPPLKGFVTSAPAKFD